MDARAPGEIAALIFPEACEQFRDLRLALVQENIARGLEDNAPWTVTAALEGPWLADILQKNTEDSISVILHLLQEKSWALRLFRSDKALKASFVFGPLLLIPPFARVILSRSSWTRWLLFVQWGSRQKCQDILRAVFPESVASLMVTEGMTDIFKVSCGNEVKYPIFPPRWHLCGVNAVFLAREYHLLGFFYHLLRLPDTTVIRRNLESFSVSEQF